MKYKIIGNKKVMGKIKGDTITVDDEIEVPSIFAYPTESHASARLL